ncbi:MAG: hypothetical protein L3J69_11400 [Desulfobacula sp.]|nr:hypothetical protein [Desulfobacula sp.]
MSILGILSARAFMHASMGVFLIVCVENKAGSLWYGGAGLENMFMVSALIGFFAIPFLLKLEN